MKISAKTHLFIRLQNILFTLLLLGSIGLAAWLSTVYQLQSDWTDNARNSLSATSVQLLAKLDQPIEVTAYASENEVLRRQISELINKYQRHKNNIKLTIINPDMRPDQARAEGISSDGELVIYYDDRRESIHRLDEQTLSNALQRLANSEQRWVVFLSGHGERDPAGIANFDYSIFSQELRNKGINSQVINLVETPVIPHNTSLLVIADPKIPLLDGELALVKDYLAAGRPLLLLSEPKQHQAIQTLSDELAISMLAGTVVDASSQLFGIDDPTFALVSQYPEHLSTQHLNTMSLFPGAAGLVIAPRSPYSSVAILSTQPRSWTETGNIEGDIHFDPDSEERAGPIDIGYALTKPLDAAKLRQQRIIVIADADFLSNSFLGNGANLDLGLSLIQWLNHDDSLIDIPAKTAHDSQLEIDSRWSIIFGLGFLLLLPLIFIGSGVVIWLKRKKL
ncbi:ABC transporter [Cycloclasticus sp. 46_120_T64]|nr:ABC transporter [Cycloclasticus sp. 46_120_T64]